MKYLRYGLFSLIKYPLFNILIMLELALILVVGNLTVATANSRSVYYDPYSSIISKDGIAYTPGFLHSTTDEKGVLSRLYESLEGDISITTGYFNSLVTKDERLVDPLFEYGETQRNCYSFDDKIYSEFNLPLEAGRWGSCRRNDLGQIEAVICRNGENNVQLGDVFRFSAVKTAENSGKATDVTFDDIGEVVVVDIIPDKMYCPGVSLGSGEKDGSVIGFYDIEETNRHFTMYIACGAEERLCDHRSIASSTALITYNIPPTEEVRKANEKKLLYTGRCRIMKMSDLKRNSDNFLYEQYIKMLPVLLCVFLIVLVELVCSVAMNTKQQLRSYGIFFLCGCRWRDVLKISLSYSLLILTGGLLLGRAAIAVFEVTEYAKMFQQNLAANNIWMTLALIGFMLAVSLIIPFGIIRTSSPVKTIRES